MSIKLMQLYLRQQDTVNKMVAEGFLLTDAVNARNGSLSVPEDTPTSSKQAAVSYGIAP